MKTFYCIDKKGILKTFNAPDGYGNETLLKNINTKFNTKFIHGNTELQKYAAYNKEDAISFNAPKGLEKNTLLEIINNMKETKDMETFTSIEEIEKGYHMCKYCGTITKSEEIDILCENCREMFGHSFYSEL